MKALTKAEEQVMQALWDLNQGFIKEVRQALPEPKPHKNTLATILKKLIEKEFVAIRLYGRLHQYYPLISKASYTRFSFKGLVKGYFDGSFNRVVSFMVNEKNLSIEDLEVFLKQLKKEAK